MAVGNGLTNEVFAIEGADIEVIQAGVKYPNRDDLVVVRLSEQTKTAGVFTQNIFCAAPVQICRDHLATSTSRALVINTGNANAGTGEQGLLDANESCKAVAKQLNIEPNQVLPFSTGVIGEFLPMDKLNQGFSKLENAQFSADWRQAATGIMTTDTRPKAFSLRGNIAGKIIKITGITKGSGMIKPNMATMLSFLVTDADCSQIDLQAVLKESVEQSYNRITVDSDTSTNDACTLSATGKSGAVITVDNLKEFQNLINQVSKTLALEMVCDGEGASKFIEVAVESCLSQEQALDVAYSVGHSPLVKTAITASDANWGRFLMAVGKTERQDIDQEKIDVWLEGMDVDNANAEKVQIVKDGMKHPDYTEEQGASVFAKEKLKIQISLNQGDVAESIWTSDLSYEYIKINAEYRT